MLMSQDRILTTHTGSLPRPPALTELYVRRSRGEAIDPARWTPSARPHCTTWSASRSPPASMSATTASSSARRSSSTCRHRMSGFGGGWTRKADGRRHALSGLPRLEGGVTTP